MKPFDSSIFDDDYLKENHLITNTFHLPYNPDLNARAKYMRNHPTFYEDFLWRNLLRNIKPRVVRQKVILNYIVDFYCTKRKLIIEVDGGIHCCNKLNDEYRDVKFLDIGIKTVRIKNIEIDENSEAVLERIHNLIIL
jgi:very-short-patch-repair endonuclease